MLAGPLILPMDYRLLHAVNQFFFHHDAVEDPAVAYANASELLFLGLLVAAFLVARGSRLEVRRAVVAAGLSAGLGLAVAQVLTRLVDRPRPFVAHPLSVHVFSHHAADAGFPSDHTTAAFAIAVALWLRDRRWGAVALVAAGALGVARVGMGVHYPGDVAAGALLGGLSAVVLWLPAVRVRLHRLADRTGRLLDSAVPFAR
jgi:undecaprenyl-diphosphatase